jgi:hypothetical protein
MTILTTPPTAPTAPTGSLASTAAVAVDTAAGHPDPSASPDLDVRVPAPGAARGRRTSRIRAAVSVAGRRWRSDDGAATAEYAIVIMAAVGFAGLLVVIMRSDEVRGVLSELVRSALSVG